MFSASICCGSVEVLRRLVNELTTFSFLRHPIRTRAIFTHALWRGSVVNAMKEKIISRRLSIAAFIVSELTFRFE